MVMSTPVRMGRVSSREAARPTFPSVSTKGSLPMAKAPLASKVEVCGKSLADQMLSEKPARPAVTGQSSNVSGTVTLTRLPTC